MFYSFLSMFSPSQGAPSALILRIPGGRADAVLHIVPEDGTIETFSVTDASSSNRTTFRQYGAVEQSREELGVVVLRALPEEWDLGFLDRDVRARVEKIMRSSSIFGAAQKEQAGSVDVSLLVEEILKPAALDAIRAMEGRVLPKDAAVETYHVSIIYVNRKKPGPICGEPRSIM